MTVIALASIKGSPGVTTAATAIAASWPTGRKVLLVEADPFGGDLAPRFAVNVTGGLPSVFAAARRTLTAAAMWDHVDELPGGLPVLFGLTNVDQAVANEKAWPNITAALGQLDADVVVDVGRLLPGFAGGIRHVLDIADTLIVLCEPTLEAIVHLRDSLPALGAVMRSRQLLLIPTSRVGFPAEEIATTLQITVGPRMPDDPNAAAALANRRTVRKLERTRLLKWAVSVVAALGVQELPAHIAPLAESSGGDLDHELTAIQTHDVNAPTLSENPAGIETEAVTVGSMWDTGR